MNYYSIKLINSSGVVVAVPEIAQAWHNVFLLVEPLVHLTRDNPHEVRKFTHHLLHPLFKKKKK